MKIIGIDIGTTSICAVVTDADSGELIASVSAPNRAFIASDKPFEKIQDPAVIMSTVRELISSLGTHDAAAIGFSGQMHGILYTDSCGNRSARSIFGRMSVRHSLIRTARPMPNSSAASRVTALLPIFIMRSTA